PAPAVTRWAGNSDPALGRAVPPTQAAVPEFDPTTAFDRVLPGTHSGHIDLTITALSPVHVGPVTDGLPFRWPGSTDRPGQFAIPAYSLRGMIRAQLALLLGGGLGLPEDDPMPVLER